MDMLTSGLFSWLRGLGVDEGAWGEAAYQGLAVLGLVALSVVSRSAFFLSDRAWSLPAWVERGLRYAPMAALAAVVLPEVLLQGGHWPTHWMDPRFVAAPVAALWAWWRKDMLGTILVGMAVYLALRAWWG
jgi:branched-subunit amino acid transport protein